MGKVVVVRPDGSKTEVTKEQAKKLEVLGYREESKEELVDRAVETANKEFYSQPLEQLETVAEGWAGTATFGASDKLNPDIEGARQRAKYNPVHRIGGEIGAGVLGSVIAPGMGSRSLATRIGAEAGAGAAFGMGNAVSQSALSGDPLTVTSVLAHGGVGALLGTGTGLAGEAVIGAAGRLKRGKIADEVFNPGEETLFSFPKEKVARKGKQVPEWVTAAKNTPDDDFIREFSEEVVQPVSKSTRSTYDLVPQDKYSNFHRSIQDVTSTSKLVVDDVESQLLAKQKELRDLNKYMRRAGKSNKDAAKLTEAFSKSAINPESSMFKDVSNKFTFIDDHYKVYLKALKEGDPVKAIKTLKEYKAMVKAEAGDVKFKAMSLPSVKKVQQRMDEIKSIEDIIKLKAAAKELGGIPNSPSAFASLSKDKAERLFASADLLASKPDFRDALNSVDELLFEAGVTKSGSPGERLRALWEITKSPSFKQSATNKVISGVPKEVRRAQFIHPGKTPEVDAPVSKGPWNPPPKKDFTDSPLFEATVDFGIDAAPGNVIKGTKSGGYTSKQGFFSRIVRLAGARKASAYAKHMGMGVGGSAAAYELGGALAGAITGGGLIAGVAGVKAAVMGRIASGVMKYGPGIGKGVKKVGGRVDPLFTRIDGTIDARREDSDRKKALKARIDEINALGPGVKDAAFFAVQPLMGEYPEFAKGLHDAFVTAFNGLIQFIPRDPGLSFNRGKSNWSPTDIEARTFEKALSVFHDPIGAVDSILTGVADMIVVKALKTMYPPIYEEMKNGLISKMMNPEFMNSLSYEDQARLFITTEIPTHSSFTPRSIAQSQSVYARANENRQPPPNPSSNGGGRPAKSEPPTMGQSLAGK